MSDAVVNPTTPDEANHIPQPENITVSHDGADLLIVRKWGTYEGIKSVAAGVFAVIVMLWLSSTMNLSQALTSGTLSVTDGLGAVLFVGIFFVLAAYFLATGLYQIINSTTIRVNTNEISTAHHPLPWQTTTAPTAQVKQVFVVQHKKVINTSDRKQGQRKPSDFSYSVNLLLADGTKQRLIRQLPDGLQARYIEQQIERHLHLDDTAVEGEHVVYQRPF